MPSWLASLLAGLGSFFSWLFSAKERLRRLELDLSERKGREDVERERLEAGYRRIEHEAKPSGPAVAERLKAALDRLRRPRR